MIRCLVRTGSLAALAVLAFPLHAADRALLRIGCDGDNIGARVSIDGEMRGDCPFDTAVTPGELLIEAVRPIDPSTERRFQTRVFVGANTQKRIDIELSAPQLTAEGRRIEAERVAREKAEREQRAAEQARAEADQAAARRRDLDSVVDILVSNRRARRGTAGSNCPDCPIAVHSKLRIDRTMPSSADPMIQGFIDRASAAMTVFLADRANAYRPPDQPPGAPPCPAADLTMRRLAGLLDFSEMDADERLYPETPRTFPQLTVAIPQYVRDLRLWPIRAQCVDGRLDGPLDYWISGHLVYGYRTATTAGVAPEGKPLLVHVQATMRNGKAVGPIEKAQRRSAYLRQYPGQNSDSIAAKEDGLDGGFDEMSFYFSEDAERAGARAVLALLMIIPDNDSKFTAGVSIFTPYSTDIARVAMFYGNQLKESYYSRRGVRHGPSVEPPSKIWKNGLTTCFQNGDIVERNPCPIDAMAGISAPTGD